MLSFHVFPPAKNFGEKSERPSVINSKTVHVDIRIHSEFVRNDTTCLVQSVVNSVSWLPLHTVTNLHVHVYYEGVASSSDARTHVSPPLPNGREGSQATRASADLSYLPGPLHLAQNAAMSTLLLS